MKNAFYFMLKALFVIEIFKFLSWVFGYVEKQLDKKVKAYSKIYNVTDWSRHIAQYLNKVKTIKQWNFVS